MGVNIVKPDRSVIETLTLITQFGINMLVPILFCSFLGIFLDRRLGTNFIMIILFFIGAISGGYNVYRMSKRYMKKDDPYASYRHVGRADKEPLEGASLVNDEENRKNGI